MELNIIAKDVEVVVLSLGSDLPKGWRAATLRDLFTFGGGLSASRDQLSEDGIAYLHYGDIHLSSKTFIDLDQEHHSTPKLNVPLSTVNSKHLLQHGDIVFVDASEDENGITKHVAISNIQGRPFISGLHTIIAKPIGAELDIGFMRYCFQSRRIWKQFRYYAVGTKVTGISKGNIGNVVLCYPPLPEQRAIATALSDVDGLLAGLDALIAKKQALKQGAMQQLLTGKQRLPGFKGEWVVRRLGEVAHIKTGARNNEDKVEGGTYPFFVRSEHVERINSFSHDCEAILVPGEGRIGEIFHYINGKFDVHQRVYAITQFIPGVSGRFIHAYLRQYFGPWAMQNTVKATVDSLRLPTFQNFQMNLPQAVEEQTAIAEVLSDMDAELAALEARRAKTALLKQGMMQELLTGRTRLV